MTWDVEGKTALVTGANSGIAADELTKRTGVPVEVMTVDLASLESVRKFAAEFLAGHDALHILVNNAGGTWSQRRVTEDGHETTFQVNHLGPFLLTHLLLERIKASAPARIVNTSSTGHNFSKGLDFEDLDRERRRYASMRAYADSKLCNIYFAQQLADRLEGTGVTAYSFHPGFVRTNFGHEGDTFLLSIGARLGSPFARSPKKGAETGVHLASEPGIEDLNGQYFFNCKPKRTSKAAQDGAAACRLWDVSEELVGLTEVQS
ncbi:MAG: SDR family oxidoreductase [Actinobacteria bacterium]|nr:SDR family oxidoreductase [Actinomycetota bacterium]